jgi:NAD(P)-dependent dehydrogenase (short-subunit alcohol dehydrogenase family)
MANVDLDRVARTLLTENGYPIRVAIVTGASSGIGRSTAMRLAELQYHTVVADLDSEGGQSVVDEITSAGGRAELATADVADSESCKRLIDAAGLAGPLAVLVNAAGVMVSDDSVETVADADLERLLSVNLMAIFRLGRHAIPAMRAAGGGVMVNITSVHAFATMDRCAAYAASKGAICSLTRQMAIDLAPDQIRVVAVAPGSVDTPMTRAELARRGVTAEGAGFSRLPGELGRVTSPDEVGDVVAWLTTPAATLLNGSTVIADAGLLTQLV